MFLGPLLSKRLNGGFRLDVVSTRPSEDLLGALANGLTELVARAADRAPIQARHLMALDGGHMGWW